MLQDELAVILLKLPVYVPPERFFNKRFNKRNVDNWYLKFSTFIEHKRVIFWKTGRNNKVSYQF